MEIALQRKVRTGEWGRAINPTMPMETILDNLSDERLHDMEADVMKSLGRR